MLTIFVTIRIVIAHIVMTVFGEGPDLPPALPEPGVTVFEFAIGILF
jgi:hypothetical protein